MSYDYLFKYILIGNTGILEHNKGVGKSNIRSKFIENKFSQMHLQTIGVDIGTKIINIDGFNVKFQIFDITETEGYKTTQRNIYKQAAGALIVYDVTKRDTFDNILYWIQSLGEFGNDNLHIILIANKIDQSNREVSTEEGEILAKQHNINFIETSAKTGQNIDQAFIFIGQEILKNIKYIDLRDQNCGIKKQEYHTQNSVKEQRSIFNSIKQSIQEKCYWLCISKNSLLNAAYSDIRNHYFESPNIEQILGTPKMRIKFLQKILNELDEINLFVEDSLIKILKKEINRNEKTLLYDLMNQMKLFTEKNSKSHLIIIYSIPYLTVEQFQNLMTQTILNNEDKYIKNVLIQVLIQSNAINFLPFQYLIYLNVLPLQIIYQIFYQLTLLNNKPKLPQIQKYTENDKNLFLSNNIKFNIYQQTEIINEIAQKLKFDRDYNPFVGQLKHSVIYMTEIYTSEMKKVQNQAFQLIKDVPQYQRQEQLQVILKSIPQYEPDIELRRQKIEAEFQQFRELFICILKFTKVLSTFIAKDILYIRYCPLLLLHHIAVQALSFNEYQNYIYSEEQVTELLRRGYLLQYYNFKERTQVIINLVKRFKYPDQSPIKNFFKSYEFVENLENDNYQLIENILSDSQKEMKLIEQQNLENIGKNQVQHVFTQEIDDFKNEKSILINNQEDEEIKICQQ